MPFQVLDSGKPADVLNHLQAYNLKGQGWDKSLFDTFQEALEYARRWIGSANGGSDDGKTGIDIKLNIPVTYWPIGGYTIQIREI